MPAMNRAGPGTAYPPKGLRNGNVSVSLVRYLLLAIGILVLCKSNQDTSETVKVWASTFVLVGIPYRLVWRIIRLPFGLFKKRKLPQPSISIKVETVENENSWDVMPATENQLGYIKRLGGDISHPLTKSEASKLIDRLKEAKEDAEIERYKRKLKTARKDKNSL